MRAKRAIAALTALMICLSVTVQPVLADFDDAAEMTEPVLTDPVPETETPPVEGSDDEAEEEAPAVDAEVESGLSDSMMEEAPATENEPEKEKPAEEDAPVTESLPEETGASDSPVMILETVEPAATDLPEETGSSEETRASSGQELNETNFPDPVFRDKVKEYDRDQNGSLSPEELAAVTDLEVAYMGIASLKGISCFTALTSLNANGNSLTTLDLSANTALKTIMVKSNLLESIKLPAGSGNQTLEVLNVSDNRLTSLDVSNMQTLTNLWADNNCLTSLDLSNCPLDNGQSFSVVDNYLTQITLPVSGTVDWQSNLARQRLPGDKQVGYTLNWYTDPAGQQPLQVTDGSLACTGQTLYIKAEPIRYTLKFSAGGEAVSGSVNNLNATYDQPVSLPDCGFIPNDPEREFAGWKWNGQVYQAQQQVKNLTDVNGKQLELVAQWKYKDYSGTQFTITLHDGDGKNEPFQANYSQDVPVTTNLTQAHHHLVGWARTQGGAVWLAAGETLSYDRPSQLAADLGPSANLYAVWAKDRHTVSFAGITPAPNDVTVEYGSTIQLPVAPHRTGYVFEGWYTDGGKAWQQGVDVVEQDMTLTARYRAVQFTVKLDGNGADVGTMQEMQVTYDQAQNLPQNGYTRQWHDFAGWAFTPEGSAEVMDQADVSRLCITDGDTVTLYAVWERQKTDVTVTVEGTQHQYQNGLGTVLDIPAPQRTGWKFLGWKDEHGSLWQQSTLVTGPLTLTAEFAPIQYTLVMSGNGAANPDAMNTVKIELTYDQKVDLPANQYTRAGYKFLGWSRTPGGQVEFADMASVCALTTQDGATVTLYAVWQAPQTASSNNPQNTTTSSSSGKEETAAPVVTPAPQTVVTAPAVQAPSTGRVAAPHHNGSVVAAVEEQTTAEKEPAAESSPVQTEPETTQGQQEAAGEQETVPATVQKEQPAWIRILAVAVGALVVVGGGLFGAVHALRRKNR